MATIGYADLPVPGGGDAPAWPGALAALAEAVDPHLTQHVTDKAARDTLYATAPRHTLVSADDGSLWLKTSPSTSNVWATIYEPLPAWRPITLLSGYQTSTLTPQIRRVGQQVWMRGRIARVDGTPIPMSGVAIATVPSDCIPAQLGNVQGGESLSGDPMTGVGRIEVSSPNEAGTHGTVSWYSQDGIQNPGGTGAMWLDLSGGSYWLD